MGRSRCKKYQGSYLSVVFPLDYTVQNCLCVEMLSWMQYLAEKKENELKHQGRFLLHVQPLGQTDLTWYNTAGSD